MMNLLLHLRNLLGCSGILAAVAFVLVFLGSLVTRGSTWSERAFMAGMTSVLVFGAALMLGIRDTMRHSRICRSARDYLLARDDSSEDEFLGCLPTNNTMLLLETRSAIARFFDVPVAKIHREVRLIEDLHVDQIDAPFQFSVVNSVLASQSVTPKPFWFSIEGLKSIDDLTQAIQNVLDRWEQDDDTPPT